MSPFDADSAPTDKDGEPIDPLLPDWLLPGWFRETVRLDGGSRHRGHRPVIVAPGTTVDKMEAIRLAKDEDESFVGKSPTWWRVGRRVFPVLWVSASCGLAVWLDLSRRTNYTWWYDREWLIACALIVVGVLVYYVVLRPLARRQEERARRGAFPTTASLIAEVSATSAQPRARFVSEDIADAVRAIHSRAPQHDDELRSLVWEWSLAEDEATLRRIDALWQRVDPEGFAQYEAEVAALWAEAEKRLDG